MDKNCVIEVYFTLWMSYKDITKSVALQGIIFTEKHLNRLWRAFQAEVRLGRRDGFCCSGNIYLYLIKTIQLIFFLIENDTYILF